MRKDLSLAFFMGRLSGFEGGSFFDSLFIPASKFLYNA
ncbi:hypothetical protein SD77_0086 [Bacillus badius]|uniref:Uncharacterized protein n=1 Tax=Bacillus badius TaxID=1455 RepID=A0ABR5B155_BACBA|nr:hypothetical protein SD78_3414 [Bacillus badius]KIL80238.1 hypothetical protein SD77_0086 [Bacillus badius]